MTLTTAMIAPGRDLALELVRVTEAGALAAAPWIGRGNKEAGDGAAVDAMRAMLTTVSMRGVVVIGEGEKDAAPMLFNGETVGDGTGPHCDVAVDPVEGTTLLATGTPGALSVLAVAERGAMFDPSAVFYMDKIAVGPGAAHCIDLDAPATTNILNIAAALNKPPAEVTVAVLDRPRHHTLIADIQAAGARIHLIPHGDVAAAVATARPDSGIDATMGIGGTPEAILAAAALRCLGGAIHTRLAPRNDTEHRKALDAGHNLDQVLYTSDLVAGHEVFFAATGITTGPLLHGIRHRPATIETQSILMRASTGTTRIIDAHHRHQ